MTERLDDTEDESALREMGVLWSDLLPIERDVVNSRSGM